MAGMRFVLPFRAILICVTYFGFLVVFLMMRRPPRSTLFPYTTLPDLPALHALALVRVEEAVKVVRVVEHPRVDPERAKRSEEHTSELQSLTNLVCRLPLEKKNSPDILSSELAPFVPSEMWRSTAYIPH